MRHDVDSNGGRAEFAFGSATFHLRTMRDSLPGDVYGSLEKTIASGERLQPKIANAVAHAMKVWAMSRGATHYCHWFQPLTGSTAEKHDAFLTLENGVPLERFSGSQLIQGEPDASSFPSGGMRSTFEARGYTAWDPGTPAFVMANPSGTATLCVPSVFLSYNGEALDEKTPLLRSLDALSRAAVRMLRLLGNDEVRSVTAMVGAEQEYFLIDRRHFDSRPDLKMAGRTLLGARPPKGQQLADHYFGSISERVLDFMTEVERELIALGVPVRTRHNEVAPQQFEVAPYHEPANIAADHNLLLMETLRKIAARKGLALLLHEKPFEGINGSGKHVNWSLRTSCGRNLFDPGATPQANREFLVFLVAVLKAVFERAPIIRASVATAGNDHRLGANEAPPAVMSVFIGEQLTRLLDAVAGGTVTDEAEPGVLSTGLPSLPTIARDNTDRNRTSPFAFTGNKFEFRAVGSSMSISMPATVLNTVVAEALETMADSLEARLANGGDPEGALRELLRAEIRNSRPIRFEGDGYSGAWAEEAERRGLPDLRTSADALEAWTCPDTRGVFRKLDVFKAGEMAARFQVRMEQYASALEIEGRTLLQMVRTMVLPAGMRYQGQVAHSIAGLLEVSRRSGTLAEGRYDPQVALLDTLASSVAKLIELTERLDEILAGIDKEHDIRARARLCTDALIPAMRQLRSVADGLEQIVDQEAWPMPTYLDMLFDV